MLERDAVFAINNLSIELICSVSEVGFQVMGSKRLRDQGVTCRVESSRQDKIDRGQRFDD